MRSLKQLIIDKENIKAHLNQAIAEADLVMKEWRDKNKIVIDLQNKLMNINSLITNNHEDTNRS